MKIFNLPRRAGKTTRMLYASEYHNAPILCGNEGMKYGITKMAHQLNIDIPEPITIHDIINHRVKTQGYRGVLVDEMDYVLQSILTPYGLDILSATITIEK